MWIRKKIEEIKIEEIIADDPFGDYHAKYRSPQGNNIRFKVGEFDLITNLPKGKKWTHLINPLIKKI